jgi:sarcosine oxidase subunit gamma
VVEEYLRQSPLSHLALEARARADAEDHTKAEAGVVMAERPFRGMVNLRGNARSKNFTTSFQETMGFALPTKALTSASHREVTALWMSPDEWLIVTPGNGPGMESTLRQAFGDQHVSLADVGDNYTVVEVSGAKARDVLAKGCPLDLHPREWPAGKVGGSLVSKANVVIHRSDDGDDEANPRFDLYVRRSFAEYLWLWLEDAAKEYGLRITT